MFDFNIKQNGTKSNIDQANQEQKQQNQQDSKYGESNGSDGETILF